MGAVGVEDGGDDAVAVVDGLDPGVDLVHAVGIDVYQIDHEDANGQFEMNWDFDDALVTAEIFLKMIPLLAEKGVVTLRQAREASQQTYYARLRY